MFNVNPLEIVVIVALVLVLFGPEKLPEIAVQVGKLYREFRVAADAASAEFTREIEAATRSDAISEAERKAEERRRAAATNPQVPAGEATPEQAPTTAAEAGEAEPGASSDASDPAARDEEAERTIGPPPPRPASGGDEA